MSLGPTGDGCGFDAFNRRGNKQAIQAPVGRGPDSRILPAEALMGRWGVVALMSSVVMLLSFLLFLGFFAAVGLSSMRVKEDTTDDYLVAGRGMHPALAALSAVSTWNSGYMFIGFIGFTYDVGYSAIWIGLAS